MRFAYWPFTVPGTSPNAFALALRPIILVRVIGPSKGREIRALVDSGSDDTLLPVSLIPLLGIARLTGPVSIEGIGGKTTARFGTVDLEVKDAQTVFRWSAYVGFYAEDEAVLGHKGFLNAFTATFEGRRHHLDLTPNGSALPPSFSTP